jgi:hypothetical protein
LFVDRGFRLAFARECVPDIKNYVAHSVSQTCFGKIALFVVLIFGNKGRVEGRGGDRAWLLEVTKMQRAFLTSTLIFAIESAA